MLFRSIPASPRSPSALSFAAPSLEAILDSIGVTTWRAVRVREFTDLEHSFDAITAEITATDDRAPLTIVAVYVLGIDPATLLPAWLFEGMSGDDVGARAHLDFLRACALRGEDRRWRFESRALAAFLARDPAFPRLAIAADLASIERRRADLAREQDHLLARLEIDAARACEQDRLALRDRRVDLEAKAAAFTWPGEAPAPFDLEAAAETAKASLEAGARLEWNEFAAAIIDRDGVAAEFERGSSSAPMRAVAFRSTGAARRHDAAVAALTGR